MILPDGQMNVLVDQDGVFVATNESNPRRWVETEEGTYVAAETLTRRQRRMYQRRSAKRKARA